MAGKMSNLNYSHLGAIPENWKLIPANQFCTRVEDGTHYTPEKTETGKYLITSKHLMGERLDFQSAYFISEDNFTAYNKRSKVEKWDILIGMIGAYLGGVYLETNDDVNYAIKNVGLFKVGDELKARWLYLYLRSELAKRHLDVIRTGSSQPFISLGAIREFPILVPPDKKIMREIVELFQCIDDKIELNRRMNETLEGIAQALWGEWFGKYASGEEELPEGWSWGILGEILIAKGGGTPSTKEIEYWDGNIPWTSPKDLSNLRFPVLLETEKMISEKGLKQISSGLLPKGTLLLSSRAPIGYLAITQIPVAINQGYIAIEAINGFSNLFILYWLMANMEKVVERANGSTFLEINKANFREIPILIPTLDTHAEFLEVITPIFQQIIENEKQSKALSIIRDILLPKLMQNEINF